VQLQAFLRMSDLSFFDPPIEIAAGSPRLEMITSRLRASGMRPYPASTPIDFSAPDPLLIDIATVSRETLDGLSRATMVQVHRQIVILDLSDTQIPAAGEAVLLRRDRDLGGLRSRLAALARRASRLKEAEARRDTASALGVRIPPADLNAVPTLLYLGEGSPLFLSLQGLLKQRGIAVTAALSRQTAQQYMAERRFAAALVDLDSYKDEDSITGHWIAEENGLGILPMIALSYPGLPLTERQITILAQATEVVDAAGRMAQIVSLIETVCRRLVAFTPLMPHPGEHHQLTDFTTGLFNLAFMEAHVARQMEIATQRAEHLSVLTFCLDPVLAQSIKAQQDFAGIIRSQIRDSDCPSLLRPGTFAISLPATPYRGAIRLAERIASAVEKNAPGIGTRYGWRITEKRAYHTPKTLLVTGQVGPMLRPSIAA
jgi:GGDEF domain-containing protein